LFAVGNIKFPKFSGDSFLTLPAVTSGDIELEIVIKFKPSSDSGLLLFTSEHADGKGDFFSLGLINGFVEFRYVKWFFSFDVN
jgi:coxsackievirus/adenovirus receptor